MRLRAAASALFPPEGEEKKSKIEAERHRLDSVALRAPCWNLCEWKPD
jgi:hypothetical protein